MPRFLYIFGYQTPLQADACAGAETDEHSEALFIEADSAEQALDWGREVSEEFVRRLFPTPISWKSMNFAHGLEPESEFPPTVLANLPCVKAGSYPDFAGFKS